MRNLPRLYNLKPEQIYEVERDLRYFFLLGYKIILVPDAHELYEYCFPVDPTDEDTEIGLEELAESQAGLGYLFKPEELERPPVVMLDDYRDELKNLLNRMLREADPAHDNAERLVKLIKPVDFDNITQQELAAIKSKLDDIVKDDFQFILTILTGIHLLGTSRMNEVYTRGLASILDAVQPEDRDHFKTLWKDYRGSRIYYAICERLEQYDAGLGLAPTEERRRANSADAAAIDRLIYLNGKADLDGPPGPLKNNYLFLYVSSAPRTAAVFDMDKVKDAIPEVRGRRYPFWRNREQVFAYVVHRSRGAELRENILRTIRSLRAFKEQAKKVRDFEQVAKSELADCHDCVLTGGTPNSCPFLSHCQDVQAAAERINLKKQGEINRELFRLIESYKSRRESVASGLNLPPKVYLQLFADLVESSPFRDITLERLHQRHLWLYRASEWTPFFSRMTDGLDPTKEHDLRAEKDQVTGIDQHLPCKPEFESPAYREIIALILQFFREPKRLDRFEEAYHKFLELEPNPKPGERDDEYDLLRAYLYLTFSFMEETHSNVLEILLPKVEAAESDYVVRESLYILCWSARRAGSFEEADRYALQGIELFPADPRFRHGRALNTYCWVTKQSGACPYNIADAIEDSEKALELYRQGGAENVDLVGACHNNIAFFLALDLVMDAGPSPRYDTDERTRRFNLALGHMAQLESLIDKQTGWNPAHPEFFHTEAYLKYHLVLHYLAGAPFTRAEVLKTLRGARKSIGTALDIYAYAPGRYRKLKSEIEIIWERLRWSVGAWRQSGAGIQPRGGP